MLGTRCFFYEPTPRGVVRRAAIVAEECEPDPEGNPRVHLAVFKRPNADSDKEPVYCLRNIAWRPEYAGVGPLARPCAGPLEPVKQAAPRRLALVRNP